MRENSDLETPVPGADSAASGAHCPSPGVLARADGSQPARRAAGASHSAPERRRCALVLHLLLLLLGAWHVFIVASFYYANHFYTHDVGHDNYMLYNTWREGRFFWSIVLDAPHFAQHFTPTHVLLVPFHALFRHMLFLPVAECLAALSGAWAAAWMFDGIARRGRRMRSWRFSPLGLAAGALYVATPSVGSLLLANHYESFAVALGLWTLAALVNGRRALFWTLLVLTLGCKEDIPICWAGFGLWWALFGWGRGERAPMRWFRPRAKAKPRARGPRILAGVAVFALSAAWMLVAVAVMQATARIAGVDAAGYSTRYRWLGETLSERWELLREYPLLVVIPALQVWTILVPEVLLLPLLAPASLLLLVPGSYFMVLAANPPQRALDFYYAYPFLPFLCLGVALGLARLARLGAGKNRRRRLRAVLVAAILLGCAPLLCLRTRTEEKFRVPDAPSARNTWIRMTLRDTIPRSASVTAQYDLLCQLPFRRDIHPLSYKNVDRAKYLVFDRGGRAGDITFARIDGEREIDMINARIDEMLESGKARVVLNEDGLIILRLADDEGVKAPNVSNSAEPVR